MPKGNQKGGKKHKRGKKESFQERELILKDPKEDQEYAKISSIYGNGRYQLFCFDGKDRLGICAGNIKRRTRFSLNDIILVSLWDFQDSKCSIIHKYEEEDVHKLKTQGHFPDTIKLDEENPFIREEGGEGGEDYFSYDTPPDISEEEKEEKEEKEETINDSSSESDKIDLNDI